MNLICNRDARIVPFYVSARPHKNDCRVHRETRLMQDKGSSIENSTQVTVSIVSHGHGALVSSLLADLAKHCGPAVSVVLTLNMPESLEVDEAGYPFTLKIIRNASPRGFGANHNAAFKYCASRFYCILNPDVRLGENPFPTLIGELGAPKVGIVAPRIVNPEGSTEDSARRFPTPWFIVRKFCGLTTQLDYRIDQSTFSPDWVAGMFMLFRAEVFRESGGFDERYFLYYEDVDLCRRLRKLGYDVRLVPTVSATHDARRESRRNSHHMKWHLASMLRFFFTR